MPQDPNVLFFVASTSCQDLRVLLTEFATYASGVQERGIVSPAWDVQQFVGRLWWVTDEAIKKNDLKTDATPKDWLIWPYLNSANFDLQRVLDWYKYLLPVFSGCPTVESEWQGTKCHDDKTELCKEMARAWHEFAGDFARLYKGKIIANLHNVKLPPPNYQPAQDRTSMRPSSSGASISPATSLGTNGLDQPSGASTELTIRSREEDTPEGELIGDWETLDAWKYA